MAVDYIMERKLKYITNIYMSDLLNVKINKYILRFSFVKIPFHLQTTSYTFENKDGDHDLDVYSWAVFLCFSSR